MYDDSKNCAMNCPKSSILEITLKTRIYIARDKYLAYICIANDINIQTDP